MSQIRRAMSSDYMEWAKTRSRARFNLATSGVANYPLSGLPAELRDLEISGPSYYGYPPLQEALAAHCGVSPDCVVHANGTSMANHLAMAALLEPGDEALIEHPAYELLTSAASYLGAEVRRFQRDPHNGFALDPADVRRAITPRTRLIVVTNLHNPTSSLAAEDVICEIGEIATSAGARVLVDEVYLDAAFDCAPRSAFHLEGPFVVTSSLTKVYGLSGLRCGWILAQPDLARRMWRLNDLFGVVPAHSAERLSIIALAHLDRIRAHYRSLLEAQQTMVNEFFASRRDLDVRPLTLGTVAFPRVLGGRVDSLCALLREKYETTVVPGRFFEMPEHFRMGIGGDTEMLKEGLERLGKALDEL